MDIQADDVRGSLPGSVAHGPLAGCPRPVRGLLAGRCESFAEPRWRLPSCRRAGPECVDMGIPYLHPEGRRRRMLSAREPNHQAKSGSGGARDGTSRGGSASRPRCVSILRTTRPSVSSTINLLVPPQRGHSNTSIARTRLISSAHVERVGRIDRRGSGVGLGGLRARRGSVIGALSGPGAMRSRQPAAGARTP